jgi:hypothetical protein
MPLASYARVKLCNRYGVETESTIKHLYATKLAQTSKRTWKNQLFIELILSAIS